MPLFLLLQLPFWQIQAALPGIEGATVLAVAVAVAVAVWKDPGSSARAVDVAVAVLADPGCSGEEGEFQGQPRLDHCSFDSVWLEKRDWQSLRCSSSRPT